MADLGEPVRVIEVDPVELPIPLEVPEQFPAEAPEPTDPVEVPTEARLR